MKQTHVKNLRQFLRQFCGEPNAALMVFSVIERLGLFCCRIFRQMPCIESCRLENKDEMGWGGAFPSQVVRFTIFMALLLYAQRLNLKCTYQVIMYLVYMEHNHPAALNDSNTRLSRYNSRGNHVSVFILCLLLAVFNFSLKLNSFALPSKARINLLYFYPCIHFFK